MTVRSYYGLHQEPSQCTIFNNIYNNIIKKLYEAILCNPKFRLVKFTKQACTPAFSNFNHVLRVHPLIYILELDYFAMRCAGPKTKCYPPPSTIKCRIFYS